MFQLKIIMIVCSVSIIFVKPCILSNFNVILLSYLCFVYVLSVGLSVSRFLLGFREFSNLMGNLLPQKKCYYSPLYYLILVLFPFYS